MGIRSYANNYATADAIAVLFENGKTIGRVATGGVTIDAGYAGRSDSESKSDKVNL